MKREDMDKIYNLIMSGQRNQAVDQINLVGLSNMPEVLDYIADDLNQPDIAISLAKSYFRIISVKP